MNQDLKFLIVDDMVTNRLNLSMAISALGHKYECCANGKVAIELLEKKKFDIVLLDIEMPVMNGFETIKYIRSEFWGGLQKIPVIAVTAHHPSEMEEELLGMGFTAMLCKPFTPEKFETIINKYAPAQ